MGIVWRFTWAIVLGALLIFAAHAWLYDFFALDDSFISFRYAANWADGLGPVYNPGERVDGYTNFLWVALLAGADWIGLDPPVAAHALGFGLGAFSLALTGWLLRRHQVGRNQPIVAGLALGLLALDGKFVASMMDGLETPLFTALLLAAMARVWVETKQPERFKWPISGVLLGLLALTRPDGILYIPLFGLWGFWRLWRDGATREVAVRWALGSVLLAGTLIGVWFIWHWAYYGASLPNTFYAKASGALSTRLDRGIEQTINFLQGSGDLLLLVTLTLGFFYMANMEWWSLALLAVLGRVLFTLYSGGAWQGHLRFMMPAVPPLYAMVAVSVVGIWCALNREHPALASLPTRAVMAAAVALPIVAGRPNPVEMLESAHTFSDGLTSAHIAIGRQLAEEAPPDTVIAVQDAGATPYYSGLVTIDVLGLNDAHIARLPGDLYDKYDVDYVLGRQPDYIILLSRTPADASFSPMEEVDAAFYGDPRFQAAYTLREDRGAWAGYYLWLFEQRDVANP